MSGVCRFLLLGGVLLWFVGSRSVGSTAGEPATGRQTVPVHSTADEQTPPEPPNKNELSLRQRRRIVTAAFYVLGGILFVGLVLIVLTMLWGSRTRRVARKPLPEQSPGDPLWYLRPDKQTGASDVTPSEEDDESRPEQEADGTI